MKTTKKNKDFAELVEQLTDLSEKDFREAIKIAKQFRKAQRMLQKTMERQQREFRLPRTAKNNGQPIAGVDYAFQ
jgi:hypothetical protein